ncbi:MAG TPA: hypothetical protein VF432_14955 [Thermoanaerobaculia bacterium]
MKKALFALVILAVVVAAVPAPDAMADHCRRCKNFTTCFPATTGGQTFCDDTSGSCVFSGGPCSGPHPFVEVDEPLAAQFTVAVVTRLDAPQAPAGDETRVAALQTAAQQKTADR